MSTFRTQVPALCAAGLMVLGIAAQASTHAPKVGTAKTAVESRTIVRTTGSKYEDVSHVMRQVFSAGNLGPNSPAVKHAADVDMPARGGTTQKLLIYLRTPTVRKWYCDNFGLS